MLKKLPSVILPAILAAFFSLTSCDNSSPPSQSNASDPAEKADSILRTPTVLVRSGERYPSFGAKDAPVTIVEFSDLECPYCKIGATSVDSILKQYPGKIRVVFRNFPLDQACNSEIRATLHPSACEAARIALCAEKQGRFKLTYDKLFQNQARMKPGHVVSLLSDTTLDESQLSSCVDSSEIAGLISEDIQEAKSLGVSGTPVFFINGHKMEGAEPDAVWKAIMDKLI